MADQIIPLTAAPNQTFTTQLTVDGSPLTLGIELDFNEMAGYWQMAISDARGNPLIANVPLVTGWYPAANLLGQYGYLKIGSAFLLNTGNSSRDYPGPNDLALWSLLWSDTA